MKKRFTDEQVIGFLREAESGVAIKGKSARSTATTTMCRRRRTLARSC
ncbi:hypothetical protein M3O52_14750 [Xanthomonas nasturtii]|nr:hypothetical protein [Xanthomonas nasturtii]MCL1570281.1 hypothetical protein [Xanthomonas nasturtii]MCL1585712.1 hypothetical protein [Xanthomonas nasturtii]WVL54963.1 hypothetical protein M3O59_019130 [Xanthomonas nasturtii]